MGFRRVILSFAVFVVLASVVCADTKIVQLHHTGAMTVMGRDMPAKDEQRVTWVGKDRMKIDQGDVSILVRPDEKRLYFVDHENKAYTKVDLPIDLAKLIPPQMSGMLEALKFRITVNPTTQTKMIGSWKAQLYEVLMNSSMVQMSSNVWATTDVEFDTSSFNDMSEQVAVMQPGMADAVKELRKVKGFQIQSDGVMEMMGAKVMTSEKTLSIDEVKAPEGCYSPPAGYAEKPFDFMQLQQMQQ